MARNRVLPVVAAWVAVTVISVTTPPDAAAGEAWSRRPARFSAGALAQAVQASQQPKGSAPLLRTKNGKRKDSILDGGLIGAAIGGVGGSFLLVVAAGGSDDFRGAMLRVSPLTALGGFGVGMAIDALR